MKSRKNCMPANQVPTLRNNDILKLNQVPLKSSSTEITKFNFNRQIGTVNESFCN